MSDERISVSIEIEDKFTSAFNKLNDSLKVIENNLSKVNKQTENNNNTMNKFITGATQAASALAGFAVLKSVVTEFQNAEMAQNKLNKAFENSKGLGITKKELTDLGKTLEDKTLFSGEAIAQVQTKLISFKNIGGEAFQRATSLALDFATATGQDASAGATMLGKALSNPAEGLGALKKAGVDFNKEQEIMIQRMVENGQVQQAQTLILNQLEQVYKGQAEAQTQGSGAIALMTHKFSQLSEEIGKNIFGFIQPFIVFINTEVLPALNSWAGDIAKLIAILGSLVVAINGVSIALGLLTKANLILLGISLAVFGIIKAFENWETITEWMGIKLQELKIYMMEIGQAIAEWIPGFSDTKAELNKAIEDAKFKLDELNREKVFKADERRKEELEKERKAAQAENEAKLKANQQYEQMIKNLNAQGKRDKAAQVAKEIEDEFQKKIRAYDKLSAEDIEFLRSEDKRSKEQKTKQLKLQRMAYNMLSDEDKKYMDDKAEFEVKEQNKQFKKDQARNKRLMKLTSEYNRDYADAVIQAEDKITQEKNQQEIQRMMIEQNIGNARFVAAQDFFGQMSQLQQVKSREMFEIGKAAAIGSAIINAYEGISKTLATYPFPISAAMAAAQAAVAFAQVQNISAQSPQFENGGIVPGSSYTGDQVNARVNSGEMILNQRQQKNMFDALDKGNVSGNNQPQQINYVTNVKIIGNGDTYLKKQVEKTISNVEKRKLQKQQSIRGRFAV